MASLQDLTIPFADLFRSSFNLGYHPAILVGDTMNLDGQRSLVQTALDYLGYSNAQSVNTNLGPNSVADWNLQNFSFSKGQGGQLILGGVGNVSGILQIKDAQGNIIVQGNNLGTEYFDTAGHQLITVDDVGLHAFDTAGHQLVEVDNVGLHTFNASAVEQIRASNSGFGVFGAGGALSATVYFALNPADVKQGFLGYYQAGTAIQLGATNGNKLTLYADDAVSLVTPKGGIVANNANTGQILINANFGASSIVMTAFAVAIFGDLSIGGNFSATGTKSSIAKTSQGDKLMYATESPENWFMDFCEEKDKLDPLFLEATSPPYHYIKCEDGEYQVWGKRKGYENVRLENAPKMS